MVKKNILTKRRDFIKKAGLATAAVGATTSRLGKRSPGGKTADRCQNAHQATSTS